MIATAGVAAPPVGAVQLRISRELFERMKLDLERPHAHADERVGFLAVATRTGGAETLVLGKEYYPLADERYLADDEVGARIDGKAIREAMQRILDDGLGMMHVHMHPHSGIPGFSGTDRREQPRLVEAFANVDPRVPHGMLVLSHDAGHAWLRMPGQGGLVAPALISIVGDPLTLIWPGEARDLSTARFSRQDFLGADAQHLLANARIGVMGTGGGGSHLVQQLLHLGVRHIRVFDHDRLEWSNLNRTVGATAWDAQEGTRKVGIARRLADALLPGNRMVTCPGVWQNYMDAVAECDLVLGAVDTFAGRRDIEAFCRRYLVPYLDIGMDVHAVPGEPPRMAGQVIVSLPGQCCMRCIGFLNDERLGKEAARYGAVGGRPQVVWPNGVLASTAVGIAVDLLTGWSGDRDRVLFLSYDGNRGTIGPHPRWPYIERGSCPHYRAHQVGDPVFRKVAR